MSRRRVCISATGAVTPLGDNLDAIAGGLYRGDTGIREINKFETATFGVKYAGLPEQGNERLWPKASRSLLRPPEQRYAQLAVEVLLSEFDPLSHYPADRVGCVLGVDEPSLDPQRCLELACRLKAAGVTDRRGLIRTAARHFELSELLDIDASTVLTAIHDRVAFAGYTRVYLALCSASLQAIGVARSAILQGKIDAAIVGGVSAKVTPTNLARLEAVRAVCTDGRLEGTARSRPFDRARDGFVPAEGAVLFLLEREESIRRRGGTSHARVLGYGSSLAGQHIVAPHIDELEMLLCMRRAMADSGLDPAEIDSISSHGTSTKLNDRHEGRAIARLFEGDDLPRVTATKSQHGHLIAAAGAMEVLGVIASFRDNFLPAIRNLDEVGPDIPERLHARLVRQRHDGPVRNVLKNSFGMGGLAASLVLQNPKMG